MERSSVERKEKKKISKIHFLIHPGFAEASRKLFDVYIEKTKTLGEDELMFAFPYSKTFSTPEHRDSKTRVGALKEDIERGKGYVEVIRKIKEILGDRLIVITDRMEITSPDTAQDSWDRAKRIAEARGYYFDSDVESEAYGEFCDVCVSYGAASLNIVGKLNKTTVVKPEFTDLSRVQEGVTKFKKMGPRVENPLRRRLDVG